MTFVSVRMHQKWASHVRGFVKDVASWFRRLVGSQSGQGSREAPGPSVHRSRALRFTASECRFGNVQVQTNMKCRLPINEELRGLPRSVAATFEFNLNGDWSPTVVAFAMRTSLFLKHVQNCMLSGMQRAVIRRDASPSLLTILRWYWSLCRGSSTFFYIAFMSCVVSFASGFWAGFVLSFRWIPSGVELFLMRKVVYL